MKKSNSKIHNRVISVLLAATLTTVCAFGNTVVKQVKAASTNTSYHAEPTENTGFFDSADGNPCVVDLERSGRSYWLKFYDDDGVLHNVQWANVCLESSLVTLNVTTDAKIGDDIVATDIINNEGGTVIINDSIVSNGNVNAADEISFESGTVHVTGNNTSNDYYVSEGVNMIVDDGGTLNLSGTGGTLTNFGTVTNNDTLALGYDCSGFDNYGELINNGTMNVTEFKSTDMGGTFTNNGRIFGSSITLADGFSDSATATYLVTAEFNKGNSNLSGTVIASTPYSHIKSTGGSFKLTLNDITKTISGAVDADAGDLILEDPEVGFTSDFPSEMYVGMDFDQLKSCIVTASGYDGEPYLEYSLNGSTYEEEAPTTAGTYYVRAVAPETNAYKEDTSSTKYLTVSFLPLSECDTATEDGSYLSIEGLVNDYYATGAITLRPAEGYKVASTALGHGEFASEIVFTYDELYQETYGYNFNDDMEFTLKRAAGDGAETRGATTDTIVPALKDVIFDLEAPQLISAEDSDGMVYEVADGSTIIAKNLTLIFSDDNISTVESGSLVMHPEEPASTSVGIPFEAEWGSPKSITVTAYDRAGRSTTIGFTLKYPVETPTLTVSVPNTYVGETYEPEVETNSDGIVTILYRDDSSSDNPFTEDVPYYAGNYTVKAITAETDKYASLEKTSTFKISRRTASVSISVDDSYVGEDYEPEYTTNSDGDVVISYKEQDAADDTYTTDQPTAAGDYTARIEVKQSDKYLGVSSTADFSIIRKTADAKITVANSYVGDNYEPEITSDSDGLSDAEVFYKQKDAPYSDYSKTKPYEAGDYIARLDVPMTGKYYAVQDFATFTISKRTASVKVSVPDSFVGDDYSADVTCETDAKIEITYKVRGAADDTYSSAPPTQAGDYTVRAVAPETTKYLAASDVQDFTISRRAATVKVSVPSSFVGDDISPDVTYETDAVVTVSFKVSGADDSTYVSEIPTAAGDYTARIYAPQTAKYLAATDTSEFTISRRTASVTISVPNTLVNEEYTADVSYVTDTDVTVSYKVSGEDDSTYTSEQPTAAGSYTARIYAPQTDTYLAAANTADFTISRWTATLTVSVDDTLFGKEYAPKYTSDSDGLVSIMYKPVDAPDDAFTGAAPSQPGTYTVRATVPQTDTYEAAEDRADYKITYLTAPGEVVVPDGKEGKNGYYTSQVTLHAPSGYEISLDGVKYSESIEYNDGIKSVILRRVEDGATTEVLPVTLGYKIDPKGPMIGAGSGELAEDGSSLYLDEMELVIADDHLASVTVNGKPAEVKNGEARVKLESLDDTITFRIVAEDEAGNVSEYTITLSAVWLEDGVIPGGRLIPLKPNKQYKLGEGTWEVDGDPTSYPGDTTVFVDSDKLVTLNEK